MKSKPWTENELNALKAPVADKYVAKELGRTEDSVRNKRKRMGINHSGCLPADELPATTVEQDKAHRNEDFWREQHSDLQKKYDKLVKEQTIVDRLVSNIRDLAPTAYSPLPQVSGHRSSGGKAQSALLMFSDTHIGKVTKPNQTLTFGNYNFAVFCARLKALEDAVISIIKNHTTTPITELVVAMLGDMLDGTLVHSNEAGQADPIFNQYYCGAHVVAQFLRNLAPHFPTLRIFDVVGNHTRFQNQHRMPTKNRYSNFDNFFYALVRSLVRDIKNIEWKLDAQPYEIFEVRGFTFFAAHGDTLRGGDKALGVPNHAMGRLVSTATQMLNKFGRKAPNYYLLGHLHREIVLPHATGSILVNGGFPGVDEYGLAEMFTPADPSQKLFMVHDTYGKTATYDINLKHAQTHPDFPHAPYDVPGEFTME